MRKHRRTASVAIAAAIGLLTASASQAHHAFAAEFDPTKPVRVQGAIVKVQWTNPHVWFFVDATGADGQVEHWMFEGNGPGALTRRGFTRDYLKPGTEIIVEGFLSKGVPHRANARSMTYPDGRTLFVGSSGTGAPEDGKDPGGK
jgi:hypothetical protein